ncbi:hypothetical protein TNCV_2603221 [Trichonephila clavipes]|nr:hypothetical protein TNCV_2603221 [Trichonephila clavipes]
MLQWTVVLAQEFMTDNGTVVMIAITCYVMLHPASGVFIKIGCFSYHSSRSGHSFLTRSWTRDDENGFLRNLGVPLRSTDSMAAKLYPCTACWPIGMAVLLRQQYLFLMNVKTSWKSADETNAGKAIGCAGVQTLLKLLELERLLELDHVSALVSHAAVGSLVVRATDSRPEGLGLMPDANKYPPSTRGFNAKIVEMEIGVGSPSIDPLGNLAELNRTVTYMVLKANDRHTSSPLPR